MIFQDPMSSLNPIMKIGKQLTEAMILNGRSRQNTARKDFNAYLRALKNECISAGCDAKKSHGDVRSSFKTGKKAVGTHQCRK